MRKQQDKLRWYDWWIIFTFVVVGFVCFEYVHSFPEIRARDERIHQNEYKDYWEGVRGYGD